VAALRKAGIRAILSVNEGLLCHKQDFAAAGIAYACIPLSANAPPRPGDEELCAHALPQAYAFVRAQMAQGRSTLVHCSSGKDRTGLFFCYFLMRHARMAAGEAIEAVRKVRPVALSAEGWEDFAIRVLSSKETG
jgi:protein-tyrosine phosphatase